MSRIFLSETVVLVSVHCCLPQLKVAWSSKYCWLFCFHSENVSGKRDETPRRVIQWLTHDQKMTLVKTSVPLELCVLLPTFKPFTANEVASCENTDFWIYNYPVVTPYTGVLSLASKQVCLGLVKIAKCTDFLAKKILFSAFSNNFSQPVT